MNWFSIQSTIKLWLISYQFREYQQNKYGYGGAYQYWVVGSQKSTTPLTVGMAISNTFFGDYQSNRLHIQLRIEGLAKALVRKFKTMDPGTWKVCAKNPLLLQFPNRGQDPQFSYSARRSMSDIWHCMKQTGYFHAKRRQVCGQRYLQVL